MWFQFWKLLCYIEMYIKLTKYYIKYIFPISIFLLLYKERYIVTTNIKMLVNYDKINISEVLVLLLSILLI